MVLFKMNKWELVGGNLLVVLELKEIFNGMVVGLELGVYSCKFVFFKICLFFERI